MEQILIEQLYGNRIKEMRQLLEKYSHKDSIRTEQNNQLVQANSVVGTHLQHCSSSNVLSKGQIISSTIKFHFSSPLDLESFQTHIQNSLQLESMLMFYIPQQNSDQTYKHKLISLEFYLLNEKVENQNNQKSENKENSSMKGALKSLEKRSNRLVVKVQCGFRKFDNVRDDSKDIKFKKLISREVVYDGAFHKSMASFVINRERQKLLNLLITKSAQTQTTQTLQNPFSSIKLTHHLSSLTHPESLTQSSPSSSNFQLNLYQEIKMFKQAQYKLQKKKLQQQQRQKELEEQQQKRKEQQEIMAKRKFQQEKMKIQKLLELQDKKQEMLMEHKRDGSVSRFFRKCACCRHSSPEGHHDLSKSRQHSTSKQHVCRQQRQSAKKGHECSHRLYNLSIKHKNSNQNNNLKPNNVSFQEDAKTVLKPKVKKDRLFQRLFNSKISKQSQRLGHNSYELLMKRMNLKNQNQHQGCENQLRGEPGSYQGRRCLCCANKDDSKEVTAFRYLKAKKHPKRLNDFTQSFYISKSIDRANCAKKKINLGQAAHTTDLRKGKQKQPEGQFEISERKTLSECDKEDFQYQFEKFSHELKEEQSNFEESQQWNLTTTCKNHAINGYSLHDGKNKHEIIDAQQHYSLYEQNTGNNGKEVHQTETENRGEQAQQKSISMMKKLTSMEKLNFNNESNPFSLSKNKISKANLNSSQNTILQPVKKNSAHKIQSEIKLKSRDVVSMSKLKASKRKIQENKIIQTTQEDNHNIQGEQTKPQKQTYEQNNEQMNQPQCEEFAEFREDKTGTVKQIEKQQEKEQKQESKQNKSELSIPKQSQLKSTEKVKRQNSIIQRNINNITSKSKSKLPTKQQSLTKQVGKQLKPSSTTNNRTQYNLSKKHIKATKSSISLRQEGAKELNQDNKVGTIEKIIMEENINKQYVKTEQNRSALFLEQPTEQKEEGQKDEKTINSDDNKSCGIEIKEVQNINITQKTVKQNEQNETQFLNTQSPPLKNYLELTKKEFHDVELIKPENKQKERLQVAEQKKLSQKVVSQQEAISINNQFQQEFSKSFKQFSIQREDNQSNEVNEQCVEQQNSLKSNLKTIKLLNEQQNVQKADQMTENAGQIIEQTSIQRQVANNRVSGELKQQGLDNNLVLKLNQQKVIKDVDHLNSKQHQSINEKNQSIYDNRKTEKDEVEIVHQVGSNEQKGNQRVQKSTKEVRNYEELNQKQQQKTINQIPHSKETINLIKNEQHPEQQIIQPKNNLIPSIEQIVSVPALVVGLQNPSNQENKQPVNSVQIASKQEVDNDKMKTQICHQSSLQIQKVEQVEQVRIVQNQDRGGQMGEKEMKVDSVLVESENKPTVSVKKQQTPIEPSVLQLQKQSEREPENSSQEQTQSKQKHQESIHPIAVNQTNDRPSIQNLPSVQQKNMISSQSVHETPFKEKSHLIDNKNIDLLPQHPCQLADPQENTEQNEVSNKTERNQKVKDQEVKSTPQAFLQEEIQATNKSRTETISENQINDQKPSLLIDLEKNLNQIQRVPHVEEALVRQTEQKCVLKRDNLPSIQQSDLEQTQLNQQIQKNNSSLKYLQQTEQRFVEKNLTGQDNHQTKNKIEPTQQNKKDSYVNLVSDPQDLPSLTQLENIPFQQCGIEDKLGTNESASIEEKNPSNNSVSKLTSRQIVSDLPVFADKSQKQVEHSEKEVIDGISLPNKIIECDHTSKKQLSPKQQLHVQNQSQVDYQQLQKANQSSISPPITNLDSKFHQEKSQLPPPSEKQIQKLQKETHKQNNIIPNQSQTTKSIKNSPQQQPIHQKDQQTPKKTLHPQKHEQKQQSLHPQVNKSPSKSIQIQTEQLVLQPYNQNQSTNFKLSSLQSTAKHSSFVVDSTQTGLTSFEQTQQFSSYQKTKQSFNNTQTSFSKKLRKFVVSKEPLSVAIRQVEQETESERTNRSNNYQRENNYVRQNHGNAIQSEAISSTQAQLPLLVSKNNESKSQTPIQQAKLKPWSSQKPEEQNSLLKLQALFNNQTKTQSEQKISQSLFQKLSPVLNPSNNSNDQNSKRMSLQALFSKLNNFGKITEHPAILNQVIKSSQQPVEESIIVLEPQTKTITTQQKAINAIRYTIKFINKYWSDKFIEDKLFCLKNKEVCLFIDQEWKLFSYMKLTHLKHFQLYQQTSKTNNAKDNIKKQKNIQAILVHIITSQLPKIDVIKCIQLLTGINLKKVKSKDHDLSVEDENKLAKKIKSFFSISHKEKSEPVYIEEKLVLKFDESHMGLITGLETYKPSMRAEVPMKQKSRQKSPHSNKLSSRQLSQKKQHILSYTLLDPTEHHTELSNSSIFLTYLTPSIKFQTLQAISQSVNTFELYLGNCMVVAADPSFRFILYKETAKDKYEMVKDGKGFVKYSAPQEKGAYLMIVEPLKNKKKQSYQDKIEQNTNNSIRKICIRYYFRELAQEGLLDRLIQCLYSGKAKTSGGGYENQKNLYLPVQKQQTAQSRTICRSQNNNDIE